MNSFPLSRSIITRLVVLVVIISIVVIQALWSLTNTSIQRASDEAQVAAVNAELEAFLEIHDSGGLDELAQRIENRLALPPDSEAEPHYLLTKDDGERLAGDLERWPGVARSGLTELPDGTRVYAQVAKPQADVQLVVARELSGGGALLNQTAIAFSLGGAAIIILIGLTGLVMAQRLARRIDRINSAFRGPDPELLAELERDPGTNDEIGELTRHSSTALNRVNRLLAEQRDLSDRIAHEMRTPLVHLDSRLVNAVRAAEDPEKAADLRGAREDLKQVVDLMESVLDISANEARRGDLTGLEPVDLSQMLARICDLYVDSVDEAGLTLTHTITPGVQYPGEAMQLTRVITNLLDNAIKYVPEGGKISVSLGPGPELFVADDGPGVPEEARGTIFERFRRGTMKFNSSSRGAGLGLALARSIAERHGLTLTLEASATGARFRMGPPRTDIEEYGGVTSAADADPANVQARP